MIERFVFETLRYYGPPSQWPFLSFEAVAGIVRNVNHPAFRGRDIRYGDGKPLLLVPGHLAGDLTVGPLAMWLAKSSTGQRLMLSGSVGDVRTR